jgi:hypothetical protein
LDHLTCRSLFAVLPSKTTTVECMPAVENLYFLPDMSRMTPRLSSEGRHWLVADTVGGANASANLYSLIETAKANNIEPYRYLVALFKKLPLAQSVDDYEALLPWNIELSPL